MGWGEGRVQRNVHEKWTKEILLRVSWPLRGSSSLHPAIVSNASNQPMSKTSKRVNVYDPMWRLILFVRSLSYFSFHRKGVSLGEVRPVSKQVHWDGRWTVPVEERSREGDASLADRSARCPISCGHAAVIHREPWTRGRGDSVEGRDGVRTAKHGRRPARHSECDRWWGRSACSFNDYLWYGGRRQVCGTHADTWTHLQTYKPHTLVYLCTCWQTQTHTHTQETQDPCGTQPRLLYQSFRCFFFFTLMSKSPVMDKCSYWGKTLSEA